MISTADPRQVPEDYLWVRHAATDSLTALDRARLTELHQGAATETPVEELLVAHPDWLRIYLAHVIGWWTIEIPEEGPLPQWSESFLDAMEGEEGPEVRRVETAIGPINW
jgi:hypothetical protein